MDKVLKLKLVEKCENGETVFQSITSVEENIYYMVENLDDYPEMAKVDMNLVDAFDYREILKKGMELAKKGYTKIEFE